MFGWLRTLNQESNYPVPDTSQLYAACLILRIGTTAFFLKLAAIRTR
jgi:hypothetical protein